MFPLIVMDSIRQQDQNNAQQILPSQEKNGIVTDICMSLGLSVGGLEEDSGNAIIRGACHLDEGPIPWEEMMMKKIKDNQRRMVEMNTDGPSASEVEGEPDEAIPSFDTGAYTNAEGCLKEENDDVRTNVQDVRPLLAIPPWMHPHEDDALMAVDAKQLYNLVIPFDLLGGDAVCNNHLHVL
ncbi:uncharacterized protein HKW66_Vig0172210 [Vigna angularis]|uniref:Uncharacterized protein n=1 Tax=Phaseolus angularis TaxID=3914 RepID=A0A8T0JQJ0_PHAAN|nr:uncharacterized protein HKW66_Vig0172210 [Vigna angularis]